MEFPYNLAKRLHFRFRLSRFRDAYHFFQAHNGKMAAILLRTDEGQFFQIDIHRLRTDELYRRPRKLDQISGERPKIDALLIAERISDLLNEMSDLPQSRKERCRRTPWLKNDIAAFSLRSTSNFRFCIEVWEVTEKKRLKQMQAGYEQHLARLAAI
jgi:hypothetical protein